MSGRDGTPIGHSCCDDACVGVLRVVCCVELKRDFRVGLFRHEFQGVDEWKTGVECAGRMFGD